MKSTISLSLLALFAMCGSATAASINLVANGSFEQGNLGIGSFQSWQTNLGDPTTFVDSSGQTGTHYGQAFDGLWAAYFGSTAADGGASISQSLAITANQRYQLTFDLANDNGGFAPLNSFAVSVGGATLLSLNNAANQDYKLYQFTFLASSATTLLRFSGSNDNSYFALDNISVAATPEPGTWTLLFGAAMTIGLGVRGKRS